MKRSVIWIDRSGSVTLSVSARNPQSSHSLRRRPNARNVSTSFLPYGGITFLINSFDYPNSLFGIIYLRWTSIPRRSGNSNSPYPFMLLKTGVRPWHLLALQLPHFQTRQMKINNYMILVTTTLIAHLGVVKESQVELFVHL